MSIHIEKSEQVGKVTVKHIRRNTEDAAVYSDGPVEKELYNKFKNDPNHANINNHTEYSSWAHQYHLSPARHNLLSWISFDPDGTALEIGAGCGAITGLLCERLKNVTALEYSHQRAMVIAQRHSTNSNLDVVVGGFQDFETEERFDYITAIGVLEYAGKFYGGSNPHESFLARSLKLLKPDGVFILAIENKIGLKYISGAPEDHTGRIFDSIYDYPHADGIRTFSKKELAELLHSAGFHNQAWYYPFPDYKMPEVVLTDEAMPHEVDSVWDLFPARIGTIPHKEILDEERFARTIAQAGLFAELANSFLVVSTKTEPRKSIRCLRFQGGDLKRKPEFRTNLRILTDGSKKEFIKSADNEKAIHFLRALPEKEALAKDFMQGCAEVVNGRLEGADMHYPYLEMPTLTEVIVKTIKGGAVDFGKSLVEQYIQFVLSLPSHICIPKEFMKEYKIASHEIPEPIRCLSRAPIDCIPRNILVGDKAWHIVDHDWMNDYPMPVDLLIFRGIFSLVVDLQTYIRTEASKERPVVIFSGHWNPHYVPLSWSEIIGGLDISLERLSIWTAKFQNGAIMRERPHTRMRFKSTNRTFTHLDVRNESEILYQLRRFFWKVGQRIFRKT